MFCMVYVSSALRVFSEKDLITLLDLSRVRNAAEDVTGILLYKEGSFMQVLEGEEATVQRIFARIARDPRHHGLIKLFQYPIRARQFPEWSMAFRNLDDPVVQRLPGYSDFLNVSLTDQSFCNNPNRVERLLQVFRSSVR